MGQNWVSNCWNIVVFDVVVFCYCCYICFCRCSCWSENVVDVFVVVVVVDVDPRNLPLKFRQNRVSNSWYIAYIEFLCCVGGWHQVIFMSSPNYVMLGWCWVELWLSWCYDNIEFYLTYKRWAYQKPNKNLQLFLPSLSMLKCSVMVWCDPVLSRALIRQREYLSVWIICRSCHATLQKSGDSYLTED